MTRYRHGLLIGKFYPPHAGHHEVIRMAARRCEYVTVLVMAAAVETVSLDDRMDWLRAEHRDDESVRVAGIRCDAPLDVADDRVWAAQVATMRAALRAARNTVPVDAVFCGEAYGDELARRFDAASVAVRRSTLSATAIRRDLPARWDDLARATRSGLACRVVVVGAESTGTTAVATALAAHYRARGGVWTRTRCVPEYGREYTTLKLTAQPLDEISWAADDFDVIAERQSAAEDAAAADGAPLLICDTDAFATSIWERRYLGAAARTGQRWAAVPRRAVYLVTDHDGVPWHDDGMREGDLAIRAAMTQWFLDDLTAAGRSWVLLTGSLQERIQLAVKTIDPLLEHAMRFGEPMHGPGFEAPP